MIHVFTAINSEAAPLRILESDDLEIIVTGVGKVNAAFAVGRTFPGSLTRKDVLSDAVVNIGISCSRDKEGLFLVNKITDSASGREFYPDILRVSGLPECPLISADDTVTEPSEGFLYDMEASAIFEASSKLISPDRIIILKVVSDGGDTSGLTPKIISDMIREHIDEIKDIVDRLREGLSGKEEGRGVSFDTLYSDLRATSSMKVQIDELIRFADSIGLDGKALFEEEIRKIGPGTLTKEKGKEVISRVRAMLTS